MIFMKFYTWLMKNRWRADPIGDLARDVHGDSSWPKKANSWVDVRDAIPAAASDPARRAVRAAWNEFELYVGGKSHLHKGSWVSGVIGSNGLDPPERSKRTKKPT
jgi:uncharacterized protein YozE (UPF0346 family)